MFRSILVPTDGSPLAEKAVYAAIDLAAQLHGSIVGISVAESTAYSPFYEGRTLAESIEADERAMQRAKEHVQRIKDLAAERNVPCEVVVSQSLSPYKEIVETAKQHHCDAIFMASHGRKGMSKVFLGSETQKVLAHTEIPVTVFH